MNNCIYFQSHERASCQFCLGYAVDRVMFEGSPTIEKREKHGKTNVSKGKSLSVHSLCKQSKLLVRSSTEAVRNADFQLNFGFWLWWLHFFPFEMCTSGALKMNFPKRTLKSEKFQIDFASGFAGQPFLCRIPLKKTSQNEAFELDAGFRLWWQFLAKTSLASFVQAKIWFFKPKSAIGKWLKKDMWMK